MAELTNLESKPAEVLGLAEASKDAAEKVKGMLDADAQDLASKLEPSVNGLGEVTITPYRDGPYLLRGPFILRDQDGAEIPNARRVVALCRCGKSRTRPFCDGTHRLVDFHAPSGSERPVDLAPAGESA